MYRKFLCIFLSNSTCISALFYSKIGHREKTQQNTEQTGKRRKALILSAFILTPLLALLVVYIVGLGRYQSCFLNGTMIDEMDVSGMTISEEQIGKYSLRVIERQADGTALEEEILGSEIGISYVSTEQFQAVLQGQNRYLWFLKQNADYRTDAPPLYEESALEEKVDALRGFQKILSKIPRMRT